MDFEIPSPRSASPHNRQSTSYLDRSANGLLLTVSLSYQTVQLSFRFVESSTMHDYLTVVI